MSNTRVSTPYFVIDYFSIGPLRLYTWGFLVALAFLVGLILAVRQARKIGVSFDKVIWLVVFVYLGAIIGGRLFFILQIPLDFLREPAEIFNINSGGMMFYGGLIGGMVAGWWYLQKIKSLPVPPLSKKENFPLLTEGGVRGELLRSLAPIIPITMVIGRLGCFLTNDHLGAITSLPWAIHWPDGTLRHPVALYLILFDLALAGFLWWWNKVPPFVKEETGGILNTKINPPRLYFTKGRNASPFFLFLILYSVGRFFLDFTRDPSADPHYGVLTVSQWISIAVLTIIFLCVLINYLKSRRISA